MHCALNVKAAKPQVTFLSNFHDVAAALLIAVSLLGLRNCLPAKMCLGF